MTTQPLDVGFAGAAPRSGYFWKLRNTFRDIGVGHEIYQFHDKHCKFVESRVSLSDMSKYVVCRDFMRDFARLAIGSSRTLDGLHYAKNHTSLAIKLTKLQKLVVLFSISTSSSPKNVTMLTANLSMLHVKRKARSWP